MIIFIGHYRPLWNKISFLGFNENIALIIISYFVFIYFLIIFLQIMKYFQYILYGEFYMVFCYMYIQFTKRIISPLFTWKN